MAILFGLRNTLARLGALAGIALSTVGHAQIPFEQVVIVVNGEQIKAAQYYQRLETLPPASQLANSALQYDPPGLVAVKMLVQETTLVQLAKEKKAYPTEAEIEESIKQSVEADPQIQTYWKQSGLSDQEVRRQVALGLATFKLQTLGINITDLEVEKHYKDNPGRFTNPKSFKLRMIAVEETGKAAVDADLKAGTAFVEVAKKHSVDVSRNDGGAMGMIPIDSLAEPVRKSIEAVKIGQVTDWLKGDKQWFKFLLEDVQAEKLQPLDAALKRDLRRSLMLDKGRVKNDIDTMLKQFRAKAVVEVREPKLKAMSDSYVASLKKP